VDFKVPGFFPFQGGEVLVGMAIPISLRRYFKTVMEDAKILRAVNISKSFSGVRVLDKVCLEVEKGKVHVLMGENGAGKSTFMNILMGMFPPDEGEVYIKDKKVSFDSAREALHHGISMIHQELLTFPELTVAENIFMGREPVTGFGWIDRKELNRQGTVLMRQLEMAIPVTAKMKNLSIGEMQMVEIVKAVSNQSSILIMDEPTSAISEKETELLFRLIETLKIQGRAVLYISHKMDEVFRLADLITVLRDGKYIATRKREEIQMDELISMIVGRELSSLYNKQPQQPGEVLLEVKGLCSAGVKDVSFSLRRGEILGISGLMGAGRTAIAHAIAGMEKITDGEILLKGKPVHIRSPRAAIANGIGLVTEDRKHLGLVLTSSVKENIILPSLKKYSWGIFRDHSKENEVADQEIAKFRIKTTSRNQVVGRLSGGNQQKVVISGINLNDPEVIILDEPTRGVDVGAKQEIYRFIGKLVSRGKAVIIISSELPEILALTDRILVVREGSIKAELSREEASQEKIMKHAMAR
jgi:inositol transport system ATP-binding protein